MLAVAFVFPGQGSQSVGMLAELGEFDAARDTFESASQVLGYDLWDLVQHGPRERLDVTECTQPAMLTVGVAMWRLWLAHGGPPPRAMAGHSLGEYSALVCSGAIGFEDAVGLVQFRGRIMQEAVPAGQGAMAAVLGLDDAEVEAACAECASATEIVEAVNFNAPGQVVIAGHAVAVDRAIEAAHARGARRAIKLPVSVPSHSSLMRAAATRLGQRLETIDLAEPDIPAYTVGLRKHHLMGMRDALVEQLHSPIRWTDKIRTMIRNHDIRLFIECGPGKVLTGLNRRIDRNVTHRAIHDPESLQAALEDAREATQ